MLPRRPVSWFSLPCSVAASGSPILSPSTLPTLSPVLSTTVMPSRTISIGPRFVTDMPADVVRCCSMRSSLCAAATLLQFDSVRSPPAVGPAASSTHFAQSIPRQYHSGDPERSGALRYRAGQRRGVAMTGIYSLKPAFQRSLGGIERWLVERRVHPDWLTGLALVLSIGGGVCLYLAAEQRWLLALVPVVAVVRTALNALDGLVARSTGLARPWGEVLNELSDRVADVSLIGGLAVASPANLLLGTGALVAMLLSSYIAILSQAAGG